MEINLTQDHEAFIARSVREGRFSSPDDAMREALELLALQENELQRTRTFVQAGLDDLDSGNYEDFTDENLRGLFSGAESAGANGSPQSGYRKPTDGALSGFSQSRS